MKKITLIGLALSMAFYSIAQNKNLDILTVKKVSMNKYVTSLKVYNNIEIIFTDEDLNSIQIVGEKSDVQNISVYDNNNVLIISTVNNDFVKEKVMVYVPAKNLTQVYVHGSSIINSTGLLSNELLDVVINGEGRSNIKTAGKLRVNTIADFTPDFTETVL